MLQRAHRKKHIDINCLFTIEIKIFKQLLLNNKNHGKIYCTNSDTQTEIIMFKKCKTL